MPPDVRKGCAFPLSFSLNLRLCLRYRMRHSLKKSGETETARHSRRCTSGGTAAKTESSDFCRNKWLKPVAIKKIELQNSQLQTVFQTISYLSRVSPNSRKDRSGKAYERIRPACFRWCKPFSRLITVPSRRARPTILRHTDRQVQRESVE